ncbi:SpoIIAA family protein [Anditalea andensis]|uniref:STAS/SEC14 domain-containing protein n=1 Tax=Anditalea andensis TaxID=1048983 RepID=A0A074LGR2_9BACT|nr:STAS/SEC14 domain-containing protein [Anditalea andensis]KEO72977.1 hypothetical protein EL17_15275 [Anditalea andensis]
MVSFLSESHGNLLAINISKVIDKHTFEAINPELEKVINDHDDPRVYLELPEFENVTPKGLYEDLTNIPSYNKLKKIAVVGDAKWKEILVKISDIMMSPHAKYFNFDEKEEAMSWVKM